VVYEGDGDKTSTRIAIAMQLVLLTELFENPRTWSNRTTAGEQRGAELSRQSLLTGSTANWDRALPRSVHGALQSFYSTGTPVHSVLKTITAH